MPNATICYTYNIYSVSDKIKEEDITRAMKGVFRFAYSSFSGPNNEYFIKQYTGSVQANDIIEIMKIISGKKVIRCN